MKIRRLALSMLTVLALLWQGATAAAMAAAMALPPPPAIAAATAAMPCHEMPGMADTADTADMATTADDAALVDHPSSQDCCGTGGHCLCAAACGAAALPVFGFALNLPTRPGPAATAITAVLRDTAPPHPFRPPIAAAV